MWPAWCSLCTCVTAPYYGYFRDELYFIACSDHLAAGYVDFAPLAAWILKANRVIFGDSLYALRLLPGLAHAADCGADRHVGTRVRRQTLRGAAFVDRRWIHAGDPRATRTRYSMNPFEPLFWMSACYLLIRVMNGRRSAVAAWAWAWRADWNREQALHALSSSPHCCSRWRVTPQRKLFANKWFWAAVAITIALALPNLIWQIQHGYPTYVDLHNVKVMHKNVELPPVPFIMQQIMMLNPMLALLWMPGIGFLLFHREGT